MDEFVFISAGDWVEIENVNELIELYGGESVVINALNESPNNIDQVLEPRNLPPTNMTVMEAKLFKDDKSSWKLWVKYGPTGN